MVRPCPVCLEPHPIESPYSRDGWILRACPATGMLYLENPPEYAELETEFAFEVTMERERVRRRETEPVWSRLSDLMKSARHAVFPRRNKFRGLLAAAWEACGRPAEFRLLDVGCGSGGVLAAFAGEYRTRGIRVIPHGVEISRALARLADGVLEPLGGRVLNLPATGGIRAFPESTFHAVLMSSYLEHETAPDEVLDALRDRLAPGGRVLIKVPNFACWNRRARGVRWCGFRFPDHVNYYTPGALRRQVRQAGLEVVRMGWADRLPLSDNMYLVAGRGG